MSGWDERARQQERRRNLKLDEPARSSPLSMREAERLAPIGNMRRHSHAHGEAFCLMPYQCMGKMDRVDARCDGQSRFSRSPGCGHRETFWNSRDGVTPFGMACPSCGGDLQHVNRRADVYAPNHVPHQGQGVWRDGTPDDAEAIMLRRIASVVGTKYQLEPGQAAEMVDAARDPGGLHEFQQGWPMFERHSS